MSSAPASPAPAAAQHSTPGARFRAALASEKPLQCVGTINAYHARMAEHCGYKAIYLSGGGVAAGSLGLPDLGISNLDDVLTDIRRITDVCNLPLLVDVDTGFGASAFNIARTTRSLIKFGAAAMHIEDQVGAKRCGHRPGKELVSTQEMVDRIKAAAASASADQSKMRSVHHQYSSSVSPFQANTGVPAGASTVPSRPTTTAAAASSWVEKMLQDAQRT